MARKKTIKVFECWQSDDRKIMNHIRKALKLAEESINNSDLPFSIEVNRDTKGNIGSVDIQKVILNKIDKSDIVVCDISCVGKNSRNDDQIINNNVAFELGYTCGKKNITGTILLANKESTNPKELPFDIRNLRTHFFSMADDKTAKKLSESIVDIITNYVKITINAPLEDAFKRIIDCIRDNKVSRTEINDLVKELYCEYETLYPSTFEPDGYLLCIYEALMKTVVITSKIKKIIEYAADYGQLDVIESVYDNLKIILKKCAPNLSSYHEIQLEYSHVICTTIILVIFGVLQDRRKWEMIEEAKENFSPIRYCNNTRAISLDSFSEISTPRFIAGYIRHGDYDSYCHPISKFYRDLCANDTQLLKYISSGDLFVYLSEDDGNKWYTPHTIDILLDDNDDMTPSFINCYKDQKGFNAIRGAMGYTNQSDARKHLWNKINSYDSQLYLMHDPLREVFRRVNIIEEKDIWHINGPAVIAIR